MDQPTTSGSEVAGEGTAFGRYLVLGQVGVGAMGVVLAAYDPELDRKVALKLLRARDEARHPEEHARLRARLGREAKAIARLSHPNLISIYDVGMHGAQVFLAMEFMSGGTLREWLERAKPSRATILSVFVAVGRGLAAAHAQGLIHRDFKPENVLFDADGRPKVADFGLARLVHAEAAPAAPPATDHGVTVTSASALDANLTATGSLAGTPAYMAPEQFTNDPIDSRTDQFAFCAALYEALYGERPFAGDNVLAIASEVLTGTVRPAPREARVPAWLRSVLLRGLARDPTARFPSMDALIKILARDREGALRRRVLTSLAALVVVFAAGVATFTVVSHRQRLAAAVARDMGIAQSALAYAQHNARTLADPRSQAFAAFDRGDRAHGEALWGGVRAAADRIRAAFARALAAAERALTVDASHAHARALFVDVLEQRLRFELEQTGRLDEAELDRLRLYDQARASELARPARIRIETTPPGARVWLERYDTRVQRYLLRPREALGATPIAELDLEPGSLLATFEVPGRATVRIAVRLGAGERLALAVPLPPADAIPSGFVYVPAGRFWFGSAEDDDLRQTFLHAAPLHEVTTGAFLIAQHEVTYRQWLVYLRALPPDERRRRTPAAVDPPIHAVLRRLHDGRYQLRLGAAEQPYLVTEGDTLAYADRDRRSRQDWRDFPVAGVSFEDAAAYAAWLSRTGRVPGARLCSDQEWERAARGADGRRFPHGDVAAPDDFNHDVTYGRKARALGPDQVGSHPASRSPFGIDDLAGNVWEWVHDGRGQPLIRGGSWLYGQLTNRANNREPAGRSLRTPTLGVRICATAQDDASRSTANPGTPASEEMAP